MRAQIIAGLLIALAAPATASTTVTAGEFLARAEPLLKKSKVSLMLSGDARKLIRLLGETADRNRTRLDADRAAGRPVTTCLPPKGKASVNTTELVAHLRALGAAERAQSFDTAFASLMAKKYPCRR